jgi:hypothetical protein
VTKKLSVSLCVFRALQREAARETKGTADSRLGCKKAVGTRMKLQARLHAKCRGLLHGTGRKLPSSLNLVETNLVTKGMV